METDGVASERLKGPISQSRLYSSGYITHSVLTQVLHKNQTTVPKTTEVYLCLHIIRRKKHHLKRYCNCPFGSQTYGPSWRHVLATVATNTRQPSGVGQQCLKEVALPFVAKFRLFYFGLSSVIINKISFRVAPGIIATSSQGTRSLGSIFTVHALSGWWYISDKLQSQRISKESKSAKVC